eukprot:786807-Amphidinium_carterae.2
MAIRMLRRHCVGVAVPDTRHHLIPGGLFVSSFGLSGLSFIGVHAVVYCSPQSLRQRCRWAFFTQGSKDRPLLAEGIDDDRAKQLREIASDGTLLQDFEELQDDKMPERSLHD